jgi:myo-inositol 2-dehydrogenase / D-chiro-inositol 1-dehydrogenase
MEKLKIAFVGTGQIAQRHLSALSTLPDVEIVGHTSPTPAHVQAAVARWGGRGYPDLETMIAQETIDAAWVTVPPDAHGAIEQRLLANNIPFLVEKPLSVDRKTADDIHALINARDVIVAVGYNWRALDMLPQVRQTLAEHPARMVIGAYHSSTPATPWWRQQQRSGGQMVEQATHVVDMARYLLGEAQVVGSRTTRSIRPQHPEADIADVTTALLQFDDVPGVFSATCLLSGTSDIRLQLIGEGLTITMTPVQVTYDYGHERHEFKTQVNTYLEQNRAFLKAVRQRNPALVCCTYADALKTHHLCLDIVEQANSV